MIPLSVLDLVPVREGGTVGQALAETAALARVAEEAGYQRFWIAEHHGMEGIAGGATAVALAHVGQATSTIRIGAGGVMLPNHNPLVIAEQFGTLEALFPGRVDLGLGRAPGADQRVAQALRRNLMEAADRFPQDVVELQARFAGEAMPIMATPGSGATVPLWILGSSLFGASLAAHLGLPFAFASHFTALQLDAALHLYRERFQPSATLAQPHVMVGISVTTADTDEEAQLLASSGEQTFVALRSGNPGKLKPPVPGYRDTLSPELQAGLDASQRASAVGNPETVRAQMQAFIKRTQADEIIVAGAIWDPKARERSLRLTIEALR